jgi:hypothetical protein
MCKHYDDEYLYGPRGCAIDEEPDCGCQSIPGGMDPVVKNFVDVLNDGAERAIFDYDDLPDDLSVAIVVNFPDIGVRRVMLCALNEWNAHLLEEFANELAETKIELPRPKTVTGNL